MKIKSTINTLHKIYLISKKSFLTIFSLSFFLILSISNAAYGDSVVSSVVTKVNYVSAGNVTTIYTHENSLGSALETAGIKMGEHDITKPATSTKLNGEEVTAYLVEAMPVLIDDNGQSWVGQSAYTETAEILKQLNVVVDGADIVTRELITDPVTDNLVGQKIVIKRAPVYTVFVDGGEVVVHSWDKTIAQILSAAKVTLNQNDTVSPAREEAAPASGQIVVTRVNYADTSEDETVDYETVYKIDTSLGLTGQRVDIAGTVGRVRKNYHIVYENGVIVSKQLTGTETIVAKQDRVVSKGAEVGRANFGYYSGMVTSFYKGYTGKHLLVTNLANGKQVTVTIIGSGPFNGPLMDMGTQPFQMLGGTLSAGYIPKVSVQLID